MRRQLRVCGMPSLHTRSSTGCFQLSTHKFPQDASATAEPLVQIDRHFVFCMQKTDLIEKSSRMALT